MFERFTDRARRVLVLAQEQARLLDHNFIGTEHLLLGLIGEGEGVAAQALQSLGVSMDAARARVEETIGPVRSPAAGAPPFTSRAKKVLELSLREALELGHNYIGTEHILLGLLREGEGVAAQVLAYLLGDLDQVRTAVMDQLAGPRPTRKGLGRMLTPFGRLAVGASESSACSHRAEDLEDALGYRRVQATAGEDDPSLAVIAVFCLRCGETLAIHPDAGPGRT